MRVENIVQSYPSSPNNANRLERAFIEEMSKYMMPESASGSFGGGIGEEQFSSFLRREYAEKLSYRIDLGLKDSSFG